MVGDKRNGDVGMLWGGLNGGIVDLSLPLS